MELISFFKYNNNSNIFDSIFFDIKYISLVFISFIKFSEDELFILLLSSFISDSSLLSC